MVTQGPKILTESQQAILDFIKKHCLQEGIPPSYREIQKAFGFKAVGTVQSHVQALIQKGALENSFNKERKARGLVPSGHRLVGLRRVPVFGEVAAGGPRDAAQLELGFVAVSDEVTKSECFGLRVVGTSMVDAGIFEGDYLIVERTQKVKDGDIVVGLLDGETTVKRFEKKLGKFFLIPENSRMKPIEVVNQNLEIQGKVVGLQRKI